jgi:hypothetical protein
VRSLERSVLTRGIVGGAVVVATGVASAACASAAQRRAVCAAWLRSRAVGAVAAASQGLRTYRSAPEAKSQREQPYKRHALAQGQHRRYAHKRPRERGRTQLGANRAGHENEVMSQCLFARNAVAGNAGASRSGQQYKSAQAARPNPSIERTSKRLRLFAAAHVERYSSARPVLHHLPSVCSPARAFGCLGQRLAAVQGRRSSRVRAVVSACTACHAEAAARECAAPTVQVQHAAPRHVRQAVLFAALGAAQPHRRSNAAAPKCAAPSVK